MEWLFDAFDIVPGLAGGGTATEQMYFKLSYTFYLNVITFALSGFLLYVYRQGLRAPGEYRDPVCGMRSDADGPSAAHDGTTYYFCSTTCKRSFGRRRRNMPIGTRRSNTTITTTDETGCDPDPGVQ